MKSVISASVIFIFITVTSFFSTVYVNRVSDEMLQYLYKNEIYFAKNSWDEAENEIEKIDERWRKSRTLMSVFLNHAIIEEVDVNVVRAKNAAQMQRKEDFFYVINKTEELILNIKEQQKINIGNIF